MRYEIVCTTRHENKSIKMLGYIEEGGNKDVYSYIEDKEKINQKIRDGNVFFFTDVDGKKVDVIAVEDDYVKTSPDGTKKNNLLHLRICRG